MIQVPHWLCCIWFFPHSHSHSAEDAAGVHRPEAQGQGQERCGRIHAQMHEVS